MRKISSGVGVERIFPVQSPLVTKVEIKARGYVRRSRLYYLRELSGKKARLHSKVRDLSGLISEEEAEALENAGEIEVAPPEPEEAAETEAAADGGKQLKGKARKKARAAEKAKRRVELEKQEKERAAQKAKAEKEAEATAEGEAEADAEADAGDEAEASTEQES